MKCISKIKNLNRATIVILTLFAASAGVGADVINPLPNIVFILADDLGWGDVGPPKNPNSPVITEHIDRLAAEGMRFTDAHTASAVCAPSRYAAMTGNYPFRGRKRWGTWQYHRESQILDGQKTVAEVLKAAGYHSAFLGKWHMGGDFYKKNSNEFYRGGYYNWQSVDFSRRFRNGPLDHGFDYSLTLPDGIQNPPYGYFENDKYTPIDPSQTELVDLPDGPFTKAGFGDPNWDSREVGYRLAQTAVDFIDSHHQQYGTQKPFFLYYASQAVHYPWTPPDEFDGDPVNGVTGLLPRLDMVVELDLQVGKIVEALEARGLDDNTLFIFTSDNGGLRESEEVLTGLHDSVGGLRGSKGRVYDGGHRVPFFVKWGDGTDAGSVIVPGSVNNQLIAVHDWVAAMYALTNQTMPADQALDSANILPLLLGEKDEPVRSYLTVDASQGFGEQVKWRTIRAGDWALLLDTTDTPRELYNMATDVEQTTNLINQSSHATLVSRLLDQYLYAMNQSTRTVPDPCGAPQPDSLTGPAIDLWKDCYDDGEWHLRATGAASGPGVIFRGDITSEDTFMGVAPYNLAPHNQTYDFIDTTDPQKIEYGFKIWGENNNGIDFQISADVPTCLMTSLQPSQTKTRLGAAQIPFSIPFDLGSLSSCAPPSEDGLECGKPSYDKTSEKAVLIWKDCTGSGIWHLRVTGGGHPTTIKYIADVTSSQGFTRLTEISIESNDTVKNIITDPNKINLILKVKKRREDGVDFEFPDSANTCFIPVNLPAGSNVKLGATKKVITGSFDLQTQVACM